MNKLYLAGAVAFGFLFIGGAWLFQDEGKTSQQSQVQQSGGVVYGAPTQSKPPATSGGGDANF